MILNANSIVQRVIQIKNGIMININLSVKSIICVKKDYSWNSSACICKNGRYLKIIADDLVIVWDEVKSVTDSVSTNVTSNVSINSDDKKIRYKMDCYILHMFLLVTILLFITVITCYIMKNIGQKKKMLAY